MSWCVRTEPCCPDQRHNWTCDGSSGLSQGPVLILPSLHLCPSGVVVCKTVPFVQTTAIVTGILTMTCIAIERYQGIVFPLKMRRHYSPKRAYKMLGTSAMLFKARSTRCCHQCQMNAPGLQSWQFAPRRAGVDRLRAGRLTNVAGAEAGGRRQNNSSLFHSCDSEQNKNWSVEQFNTCS